MGNYDDIENQIWRLTEETEYNNQSKIIKPLMSRIKLRSKKDFVIGMIIGIGLVMFFELALSF